ncbi:MAG: response regulator transcription factor [Methylocystis sp.]
MDALLEHQEISGSRMGLQKQVIIVDRRALLRECLAKCLREALNYTVSTFSDKEALGQYDFYMDACAIILGGFDEHYYAELTETIQGIVKGDTFIPIIVLSNIHEKSHAIDCFRLGVRGYIPIDTPLEIVVEAIRLTLAGGYFVPAGVVSSELCLNHYDERQPLIAGAAFTPRERVVIEALRRGKTNKIIASELRMSESTVKVHVHNVMKKLHVTNRTQAVVKIGELLAAAIGGDGKTFCHA